MPVIRRIRANPHINRLPDPPINTSFFGTLIEDLTLTEMRKFAYFFAERCGLNYSSGLGDPLSRQWEAKRTDFSDLTAGETICLTIISGLKKQVRGSEICAVSEIDPSEECVGARARVSFYPLGGQPSSNLDVLDHYEDVVRAWNITCGRRK